MVALRKVLIAGVAVLACFGIAMIAGFLDCRSAAAADTLIQPGIGVGVLKLGDGIEAVYVKIGKKKADRALKVGRGSGAEVWLSYNDMGITLVFNAARQVERIIVTSKGLPVERTAIRVGSSAADVEKNYGPGEKRKIEGNGELWKYPHQGISFTIDTVEKRVDVITVMRK